MTESRIITWWSTTGGVGKTTLAVAQAQELERQGEKVVLLDFSEARPDVYRLLDLPFLSTEDILPVIESDGPVATEKIFTRKGNLHVFTGVPLKQFEIFQEKHFAAIIQAAREKFKNIIIDTNAGIFFSATAAALKTSDEICVVLRPDMLCMEDTAAMINFLCERWGIGKEKFRFYLNRILPGKLDRETAEKILGREVIEVSQNKPKPENQFLKFLRKGGLKVANKPL